MALEPTLQIWIRPWMYLWATSDPLAVGLRLRHRRPVILRRIIFAPKVTDHVVHGKLVELSNQLQPRGSMCDSVALGWLVKAFSCKCSHVPYAKRKRVAGNDKWVELLNFFFFVLVQILNCVMNKSMVIKIHLPTFIKNKKNKKKLLTDCNPVEYTWQRYRGGDQWKHLPVKFT